MKFGLDVTREVPLKLLVLPELLNSALSELVNTWGVYAYGK